MVSGSNNSLKCIKTIKDKTSAEKYRTISKLKNHQESQIS